jgi:hypothetical protein
MRRTSTKTADFMDKTSNLAALSIKRADFMDTVRILICAVHGNEAFDGQRALWDQRKITVGNFT